MHLCFKQSIFEPQPENFLGFLKNCPKKLFSNGLVVGRSINIYCLNIQAF